MVLDREVLTKATPCLSFMRSPSVHHKFWLPSFKLQPQNKPRFIKNPFSFYNHEDQKVVLYPVTVLRTCLSTLLFTFSWRQFQKCVWGLECGSVVEHMPHICRTLGSTPSTTEGKQTKINSQDHSVAFWLLNLAHVTCYDTAFLKVHVIPFM